MHNLLNGYWILASHSWEQCFSLIFISPGGVSSCKEIFLLTLFSVFISIVCCKWRLCHNNWRNREVSTPACYFYCVTWYCKLWTSQTMYASRICWEEYTIETYSMLFKSLCCTTTKCDSQVNNYWQLLMILICKVDWFQWSTQCNVNVIFSK